MHANRRGRRRARLRARLSAGAAPFVGEPLEPRTLLAGVMLGDLNLVPQDSVPGGFLDVNGTVYFTATDSTHGLELWKTDGTAAGTALFKEFAPLEASSYIPELAQLNGVAYFTARAASGGGLPLYKTDGTDAGTVVVHASNGAQYLTVANGLLFFMSSGEYFNSGGLWRTDGTPEGTVQLHRPGTTTPYYAERFIPFGDRLYFIEQASGGWPVLYKTDGTDAGTVRVKDFTGISGMNSFVPSGGYLYFDANRTGSGQELWRSDGTEAGTDLFVDINPGPIGSAPGWFTDVNGTLYFSADDGRSGRELWKSDGTVAGTVMVKDLAPGGPAYGINPIGLAAAGGKLFFTTQRGFGLFVSDGTAAGTFSLGEMPILEWYFLRASGDRLFFKIGGGEAIESGGELWTSDGTVAGTVRVRAFGLGPASAPPGYSFVPYRGGIILSAGDAVPASPGGSAPQGLEPWFSDGTPQGTYPMADVNPDTASSLGTPRAGTVELNGRVVFAAADGTGEGVWATDGTPVGTRRLTGLSPAGTGAGNRPLVMSVARLGGAAYFTVTGADDQRGLWRTDGTPAGTARISNVYPASAVPGRPAPMVEMNGALYFSAASPGGNGVGGDPNDLELWKTDGTAAGTVRVKDVVPGPTGSGPRELTNVNGTLFFTAERGTEYDDGAVNALWKSDGTEAGTVRVSWLAGGPGRGHDASNLVALGNALLFRARRGLNWQLWRSDGTFDGTVRLREWTEPGEALSVDRSLVVLGDQVLFAAADANGRELWKSDGTVAGTALLKDIRPRDEVYPNRTSSNPRGLTVSDGKLYFTATDFETGEELWRSDGTAAGTVRVVDLRPGPEGSEPRGSVPWDSAPSIAVAGGRLYLSADDGVHGAELWETDGTAAGTRLVHDLVAGPLSAYPRVLGAAGGSVVVAADDKSHGREPWAVARGGLVAGRHAFYNNSAFDGGNPSADAADDAAIATDKAALLPGRTASVDNVTSYTRGVNGIIIDVAGLPGGAAPSAEDFEFRVFDSRGGAPAPGPAPSRVDVRRGAGAGGSDRVTLAWPDDAVRNGWLRVTVKANAHTGLAADDVFSFGNLIGKTGDGTGSALRVNALDLGAVKRALNSNSTLDGRYDFNRDGRVNALDLGAVKANLNRSLSLVPSAPTAVPPFETSTAPGLAVGRVWEEAAAGAPQLG